MSDLRDAAELALTALENTCPNNWTSVKENLRKALAQPEPEPVAWFPAPLKTEWGEDMVAADLAIDNDHTVSVYCEADQVKKVEEMLGINKEPKALRDRLAQPEWVGLTDEEIENLWEMAQAWNAPKHFYILIAAKLKEKNA